MKSVSLLETCGVREPMPTFTLISMVRMVILGSDPWKNLTTLTNLSVVRWVRLYYLSKTVLLSSYLLFRIDVLVQLFMISRSYNLAITLLTCLSCNITLLFSFEVLNANKYFHFVTKIFFLMITICMLAVTVCVAGRCVYNKSCWVGVFKEAKDPSWQQPCQLSLVPGPSWNNRYKRWHYVSLPLHFLHFWG